MDEELIEIKDNIYKFPIAKLGDIYLYCVHYKNFNDVYNKWNKRKKRINYNNIYIIMSDRDGCTDENIKEFDELDYKNKVIFVHKRMDNIKSSYYIKGTENNDKRNRIINITEYKGKFTGKRYYEDFDFVTFLNNRGV